MTFTLSIAGLAIRVTEPENRPTVAWPLRPFERFLADNATPPDITATVDVTERLPDLPRADVRFDAEAGLWTLFSASDGYVLECRDPLTLAPRSLAVISSDFRSLRIWTTSNGLPGTWSWAPMQVFNPMLEVAYVTLLGRRGGCLIHASGSVIDGCGYLFSGHSGAGKSTLAAMFADQGAVVLSDERLVLTRETDGYLMHGTPWVGSGQYAANAAGPLTALYTIAHGRHGHRLDNPSRGMLLSQLLQQTFLPQWDREAMGGTLAFLEACLRETSHGRLTFQNDPSVVAFVRRTRPAGSMVAP